MTDWSDWIGREQRQTDTLDPAFARRWLATFDRDASASGLMPQGIHFCLCTPESRTEVLGTDGHPLRDAQADSFLPPIDLPRRMWAASDIAFHSPVRPGAAIERTSRVASVAEKDGNSGPLAFVEIEHVTMADGSLAVREMQTVVYRDAAAPDAPLTPPEPDANRFDKTAWSTVRALTPSPALLFRFSAVTFNSHRIHYDAPYARGVERYRGLVVHGPLIASLLLQLAADRCGDNALRSFQFKAVSPAIAGDTLYLAMREGNQGLEFGAFAQDGRACVQAAGRLQTG